MLGLIWIYTVWHSDGIPEEIFEKVIPMMMMMIMMMMMMMIMMMMTKTRVHTGWTKQNSLTFP